MRLLTTALALTALASPAVLPAPVTAAPPRSHGQGAQVANQAVLESGQQLTAGASLRSASGRYRFIMQGDGNLVAYGPAGVGWHSNTFGAGNRAVLQGDGNLVVYSAAGRALWHAGTHGSGRSILRVQDDANLVLYAHGNRPTWNRRLAYVTSTRALTTAEQNAMTGVSWRPGCPVPLSQLRNVSVTYFDFAGQPREGSLVVRADRAADTTDVFGRLYATRYPIQQIRPIEAFGGSDDASMSANNTSAFNCRPVVGGSGYSKHAYGVAIDINPVQNPYVKGGQVLPPSGRAFLNRGSAHPAVLRADSVAVREFRARGWTWGGSWNSLEDYQHFEK